MVICFGSLLCGLNLREKPSSLKSHFPLRNFSIMSWGGFASLVFIWKITWKESAVSLTLGPHWMFQQDNGGKHTSQLVKNNAFNLQWFWRTQTIGSFLLKQRGWSDSSLRQCCNSKVVQLFLKSLQDLDCHLFEIIYQSEILHTTPFISKVQ